MPHVEIARWIREFEEEIIVILPFGLVGRLVEGVLLPLFSPFLFYRFMFVVRHGINVSYSKISKNSHCSVGVFCSLLDAFCRIRRGALRGHSAVKPNLTHPLLPLVFD